MQAQAEPVIGLAEQALAQWRQQGLCARQITIGRCQQGLGVAALVDLVGYRFMVGRIGRRHQLTPAFDLTGAQGGHGQDLEAGRVAPASVFVGQDRADGFDIRQSVARAAKLGVGDHAVDQQGGQQARVGQAPAAVQAFGQRHQRGIAVAQLQQFIAQVAVQRHLEALRPAGLGVAQRRVQNARRRWGTRDDARTARIRGTGCAGRDRKAMTV